MKKTIGIITFCDTLDNYGQVLQGYALQRYLRDNFSQYEVIFFHSSPIFAKQKIMGGIEQFLRIYFRAYVMREKKYIKKLKDRAFNTKISALNKNRNFKNFKKTHIALHSDKLHKFKGYKKEFHADCYIVGSDQVWNDGGSLKDKKYSGKHWLDYYTLNFLPKENTSKKLSYAASFGKRNFTSEFEKQYFQNALAKFDAISLRESHNIETLNQINLKSVCVPDPSMLLSKADYEMLINQDIENGQIHQTKSDDKIRQNSVFVYMLGNETSVNKDEVMDFLQKHNDLIYTNANINLSCAWDYQSEFAPTPQEWLACVKDAKLIITNSFHGCALAIVMNTPFIALKLGGGFKAMNTRFEQLFEIFGLHNRFIDNVDQLERVMNEPINWDIINKKLESWRNVGVEFLAKNLNNL